MKSSSLLFGITLTIFATNTVFADIFQNAAQCQQRLENLQGEARQFDRAWMDCVAGAAKNTIKDCRQMSSEARVAEMRRLAFERDRLQSQAEVLKPVCSRMASEESEEKRRQNNILVEEETNRKTSEKRRSISVEQYQKDRATEARNFDYAKQKDEARRNELIRKRDQLEKDKETINQTVNAQALETLNNISLQEFGTQATLTPDSDTQTYNAIQNGAQTLHRLVQNKQPKAVTKIQNEAWKGIRTKHADTLNEIKNLSSTIDNFHTENSKPSNTYIKTTSSYSAPTAASPMQNNDENLEVSLQEIGNGNYVSDSSESKTSQNQVKRSMVSEDKCPDKESAIDHQAYQVELSRISKLEPNARRCAQAQLDLKLYKSLLSSQASCRNKGNIPSLERSAQQSETDVKKLCYK